MTGPAEKAAALANLEDAIRAYNRVLDPDGTEIVTDWVVLAATFMPQYDGNYHGYLKVIPAGQAIHTTLGLLAEAQQVYLRNALLPAENPDEDDDA